MISTIYPPISNTMSFNQLHTYSPCHEEQQQASLPYQPYQPQQQLLPISSAISFSQPLSPLPTMMITDPSYYHDSPPPQFNNSSLLPLQQQQQQQQQYQHQPWKIGRTSNELMLSHEIVVPSTNHYYSQHNAMMNKSADFYNNDMLYSSPSLSTSSSSTSNSIYNQGMPSTTNSSTHYRRSSVHTSRSSSPSTSSYHESLIARSPSPVSNKRYSCRVCNKRFTRPSSLNTHIYSHTGEKPFKCPVDGCGRNFSVVSNLRRHAKIHGGTTNNSAAANPNCSTSSLTSNSY